MNVFRLTYKVGKVASETGINVNAENLKDVVITYDPLKVDKKMVTQMVRRQLMYFEEQVLESIIRRLL